MSVYKYVTILFTTFSVAAESNMKSFKVSFYFKGQSISTIIQALSQTQALMLIKAQFPTVSSFNCTELK